MADKYSKSSPGLEGPFAAAYAIPVSNNALPYTTRGIYVGTAGNVAVRMLGYSTGNTANLSQTDKIGNNDVTYVNVPAGTTLIVLATHVFTTTTANNLLALF
jgi:hypothetical protein